MYPSNMTTAEDLQKQLAQAISQVQDQREAFHIALKVAEELLDLGGPEIRNRQNLLAWGQLEVTVRLLRKELHNHLND
jgi:hypothetical protein